MASSCELLNNFMSTNNQELIETLTTSGLLSQAEINAVQQRLSGAVLSPEDLCKELIRQNLLTRLQAAAVLKGKTRNLVFGDYVVLDRIGQGGMGQVFKARHVPTGKTVALKVLSAEAVKNRRLIERFKKEARAIARLKHPNITRAYEAGKINSVRYLVMEFVDGENMLDRVKRKGPLSVDEAISVTVQAAKGLDYAHGKGIVHRDIKPSNLLRDRRSGRVKILDLGLARVEEDDPDAVRLTMPGQMLGTARFMAPEQIEDARIADVRSDLYSLGCTLYFLLRGKAPYSGETIAHTLMAHVTSPIPNLCSKRPDCPGWLGEAFKKMLAKKPADRFATMADFVALVERELSNDLSADTSHVASNHVLDDDMDDNDEFSKLINGRNEGDSLEQLYSDDREAPSAHEDMLAAESGILPNDESIPPITDVPVSASEPVDEVDLAEFAVAAPAAPAPSSDILTAASAFHLEDTPPQPIPVYTPPAALETAPAGAGSDGPPDSIRDRIKSRQDREKASLRRFQIIGGGAVVVLILIVLAVVLLR